MKVDVVSAHSRPRIVGTAVVVDVFRSSSAIATALGNGASCIIPCTNIADAVKYRRTNGRGEVVLAGERHGITPKGFDYNISPLDFTLGNIGGKKIVFTSTNLTRILAKFGKPGTIIGGFINSEAVANYLRTINRDATIIACGTREGPTIEDLAGAGAIASHLMDAYLSDEALTAIGLCESPSLPRLIAKGRIAKKIHELGREREIELCLSRNSYPVVPILKGKGIVAARS